MSARIAIPDDEIRQAVESRTPAKRLAEKYGCAETTVQMRAVRLGLRFSGRKPLATWHALAHELCKQGKTPDEIAAACGVSRESVHTFQSVHKYTRRPGLYDDAIRSAAATGKSAVQLATELRVDPNNLRDRIRQLGVKLPPAPRGANWHSEAVRLNDRGYDLQLIADATGQTPQAVQNVLRANGRRRNDPKQLDASRTSRANDSDPVEPWEIPNPNEDLGDESDEWPASVPAPTLPDELAVPALVISGGELRDSVVHGGKIVHRCDDFIDAMRWARAFEPPCFVARARDYVALCRTEAPRKRAKSMNVFGE